MSSVDLQLSELERELLAISANQAPSPAQIVTFDKTINIPSGSSVHQAIFTQGIKLYQAYSGSGRVEWETSVSPGQVIFTIYADTATTFTVVSLSDFTLI